MVYEEGGLEGMLLKQKECECPIDTMLVQLKKIRKIPDKKVSDDKDVGGLRPRTFPGDTS